MKRGECRLVQVLCGPQRHAIVALPYENGITAAQERVGGTNDITLTKDNAAAFALSLVDDAIAQGLIDPWCGICRAKRAQWFADDQKLAFTDMPTAMKALREEEQRQLATADFLKRSKG